MESPIKCENCGSNLTIDQENHLKFCPYCGAAIKIPETAFDHEKYMAEFNEKVRQQKVKEEKEKDKSATRIALIVISICISIALFPGLYYGVSSYIDSKNKEREFKKEEQKLEEISDLVKTYITEGRLDEALIETSKLRLVSKWSSEATEKWDSIREEYTKIIKEKQKLALSTCTHNWILTGNERDTGFLIFNRNHQKEYKCTICGNTEWRNDE